MRAAKYVVTTSVHGVTRSKIWDPAKPMPVDIQAKWVLERSGEVLRVRQVRGNAAYDIIGHGAMNLPHNLKLHVVPANHVSPPYQLPEGRAITDIQNREHQLLAFYGVGRGIIQAQPVHKAYVAFVRKQPVFTLYHDANGFKIKPLLDGVKFKLKKQKAIIGPVGEEWTITADQLYGASVIRGTHWWRFNLVPTSVHLEEGPDAESILEGENVGIRKALTILSGAFIAFSLAVWLAPRPVHIVDEPKEEAIVKFIAPPVKARIAEVTVMPTKVSEPVPEPAKIAVQAPPKVELAPTKVKAEENIKKPAPPTQPKIAAPVVDTKAIAQKSASDKLSMLRAALGGAASLAQKLSGKPTVVAKSAEMFNGGGAPMSPTEIKPAYNADNAKVGAVGGAYTKSEHAAVGAKGSSFVSVDVGGPTVEEGLGKEEVGAVIHAHQAEIRYCHETAMLYRPNLEGKLVISFSIAPTGKVEKSSVASSTLPDKTLEDCVMKRLVTWQFPKPKGGSHVAVSYPFSFKTIGGE